jgi:Fe-S oxidoreductase
MSGAIADILLDQIRGSDGECVVAPGASCRSQLADHGDTDHVPHPVEKLAEALA